VNFYAIEVRAVASQYDTQARKLLNEISQVPIDRVPALSAIFASQSPLTLHTAQLYQITGQLSSSCIDELIQRLLADTVVQEARIVCDPGEAHAQHTVDVYFHPGVTDTLAESVRAGARLLGINEIAHVQTGKRYLIDSRLPPAEVRLLVESLLYNPVIQYYTLQPAGARALPAAVQMSAGAQTSGVVRRVALRQLSDDELLEVSSRGMLALNIDEMRTIQQHFQALGREPSDVELETLAQTWSEHCSHKTFRATIDYCEMDSTGNVLTQETIAGLLTHYIMRATRELARPWVISAFSDNAGVISFTQSLDLAFKVETHNHPSAIEPFGGANTGVGGVIRDILGVSGQPIACTDVLCFGPPDTDTKALPDGILAPRRVASGVVNGVRDYANKMGIPTVNGALLYHPGYVYNPLVFCGCLGILPHGSHRRQVSPGDLLVVLGGRTGRDGIHGATFSSGEMSSELNARAGAAVQIGAPITEKKVAEVIIQARDQGLYSAITDCGAGGFSSAVGEMGAPCGVQVELAHVPLKYQGLAPWEIWLSEAQERMVLAVPPAKLDQLLAICEIEEVEACVPGIFTDNRRLHVTWQGETVADLAMTFLHDGRPRRVLRAQWRAPAPEEVDCAWSPRQASPRLSADDAPGMLLALLSHPTIASKEWVVRCYDHEVQGATVLKPLVGSAGNGPGDAAVLQPILDAPIAAGVILANGINPLYGLIDPYHMATCAIDEALRNLTAVGGDIARTALLDNFCWGNPADPVQLGSLVRAARGCYDAAVAFGTPFVSGKDSLNNEYRAGEQRLPVLPTLLISACAMIDEAAHTVDMALKSAGNLIYQVGITHNELAGSHYAMVLDCALDRARLAQTSVPRVDFARAPITMRALGGAIRAGLVAACHDLSEGGLAVAAAEMALAGLLGLDVDLARAPHGRQAGDALTLLFSESASRFLVEVAPQQQVAFEQFLREQRVEHAGLLGYVMQDARLLVHHDQQILIDLPVCTLQAAWTGESLPASGSETPVERGELR
jgi:phosphoribosylformylglycinamidine synthase